MVLSLLLSGNAYAEIINLNCSEYVGHGKFKKSHVYQNNLIFKIDTDKKTYEFKASNESKWTKMVILDWSGTTIKAKYSDPAYASTVEIFNYANQRAEIIENNKKIKGYLQYICKEEMTAEKKQEAIMFTIKDKREQCEAIGFKTETEKFADCVLRLVELDIKKQNQNQITSAQSSGNDALVKQLKKQSDLQSSQALINLGQQLMNPKKFNSNIYKPKVQRCTIQGYGSFANMICR